MSKLNKQYMIGLTQELFDTNDEGGMEGQGTVWNLVSTEICIKMKNINGIKKLLGFNSIVSRSTNLWDSGLNKDLFLWLSI